MQVEPVSNHSKGRAGEAVVDESMSHLSYAAEVWTDVFEGPASIAPESYCRAYQLALPDRVSDHRDNNGNM